MNQYQIEFSIYGANPTPAWRAAIVSRVTVTAEDEAGARREALTAHGLDADSIRSISPIGQSAHFGDFAPERVG